MCRTYFCKLLIFLIALIIGIWPTALPTPVKDLERSNLPTETVPRRLADGHHDLTQVPKTEAKLNEFERQKPFCHDRSIIPIWREILRDKAVRDSLGYSSDTADCKNILDIKRIDLNRDGKAEILVRGNNFHLCLYNGNCGFWVLQKSENHYHRLLFGTDYMDITENGDQVLPSRRNGFSDIVMKMHINASDTEYSYFGFDGRRYILRKCLVNTPKAGSYEDPKWEFITCNKYQRRIG